VLICFLWSSLYGLNFGTHWDETTAKFDSIKDTLKTGVFLQGAGETQGASYNYGGVNYMLTWLGFAPEVTHFLFHDDFTREKLSNAITPELYSLQSRLRVRQIYLVLCALSIVWLYALALVLGRSRLEAFLAAAILACSWEFAYHSRWIAPDGVMMQFGLLCFLCLAIGLARQSNRWFNVAAVAAGVAAGTKYPGVFVLPFLLIGAAYLERQRGSSARAAFQRILKLAAITVVTFVITSPAVLLDPFRFFAELKWQRTVYATSWYGYTIKPGMEHFLRLMKYFSFQLFSHYWGISIVLAALCIIGILAMVRERRLVTLLMLAFALLYVGYFSQQGAMIVRNLLVVVPVLCLASARGVMTVAHYARPRLRPVFAAVVAMLLAVNLGWEIYAALTIKFRNHFEHFVQQFANYVAQSPEETFFVSKKLTNVLQKSVGNIPSNIVADPQAAYTKVAFLQTESADIFWEKWPSNWWGMYETTFGPLEVNLEAYSTFIGNQRILVTTVEHFRRLPIKQAVLLEP
jgi:4-amino-4-deoxy-L-arabinose transferase-like glycosyltransferase